jgi:hypothetical protein
MIQEDVKINCMFSSTFRKSDLEKRLAIKDQVENIINYEKWLYPN